MRLLMPYSRPMIGNIRKMVAQPTLSSRSTNTWRSNCPGRMSAGSSVSGRLVDAMRMTPTLASKPSYPTSSWWRVCSRSPCPPPLLAPRAMPRAFNSSMKMMYGAVIGVDHVVLPAFRQTTCQASCAGMWLAKAASIASSIRSVVMNSISPRTSSGSSSMSD